MEEYRYLLDIAVILALTKSFSLFSRKVNMPPVVGALIAGIILGPVMLNVIEPSDTILSLAEIGVIVLMFQAGLETDIRELKRSGKAAMVIALCGVVVPLAVGAVISVSITVETLQDMGKLKGRVGTAILGAAIIDDILGIILLSVMTSIGKAGTVELTGVLMIIGKMALFFVISGAGGIFVYKFFRRMSTMKVNNEQVH